MHQEARLSKNGVLTRMTWPPRWLLAVLVSVSVSFCTVSGFAMQAIALRKAARDAKAGLKSMWPNVGEIVVSPLWVLGAILQSVPNFLGDVVAYTLAPMSLTAPLSGVSVVLNTTFSPRLLGEKLQYWPDVPATVFIVIGTVLTTCMGAHRDLEVSSVLSLEKLVLRSDALVLMLGVALTLVVSVWLQVINRARIEDEAVERSENPPIWQVVLPAWSAAGVASLTNIALKAFSEFLKISLRASVVCFFLCVFPCAMLQIQSINRGLRLYPQTVFFPIYSSLLVLANSLLGSLVFEEYASMTGQKIAFFGLGVTCVMAGISLYSLRTSGKTQEDESLAGPLLGAS